MSKIDFNLDEIESLKKDPEEAQAETEEKVYQRIKNKIIKDFITIDAMNDILSQIYNETGVRYEMPEQTISIIPDEEISEPPLKGLKDED